jgi:hypothetical protein
MAEIVCIIGNKGGTGKTTLSHMLAHGLGLLGQRAVCVLTDSGREPLEPAGRRYLIADARSREALGKVVDKIRALPGWIGVIDGGANRTDMDRRLYGLANVVLLPFRDSHEDLRTVMRDLESFPRAMALPSQWPTNPWQREAAQRTVGEVLTPHRARLLDPVPALASSKLLLHKDIPERLPTPLANACRALAGQVLDCLQIGWDAALEESDAEGEAPTPGARAADAARYPTLLGGDRPH